jgi:transposase
MERDGKKGVHFDVPINGFSGRLEVIEGPTGRRQRTQAEKARIVAESLMPGVRGSEVACRPEGLRRPCRPRLSCLPAP